MIDIKQISKSFGHQVILDDLSLSISEGKIFGLLGKNGAGKTTLMKIILGLLKADEGVVTVHGEIVTFGHTATNKYVGYLPDVPAFYPYMTAFEYLMLCAEIAQIPKNERTKKALHFLQVVGLEKNKKRIGGFSRGMKQRLGIAQALLHEPKVLICDEPTSALDPQGRKEILEILQNIKTHTTVIFSTHILNDAEKICDEIALLHEGKFVLSGSLQDILKQFQKPILHIDLLEIEHASLFKQQFPVANQQLNHFTIQTTDLQQLQQEIFTFCIEKNMTIQNISIEQSSLDDIFLEVTSNE